jgi:predicted transglutaminase-like protease
VKTQLGLNVKTDTFVKAVATTITHTVKTVVNITQMKKCTHIEELSFVKTVTMLVLKTKTTMISKFVNLKGDKYYE